mmetsp:Transcript_487/g.692  ORF Transcript_487/g.692 Transcript_487/m.692 type:complete len:123 (-) Transcript_487:301-669(-)|eukprot:CAMPEP_0175103528 /NCGR_PEP_ID=MMETSP0086_2-20121207/9141_1 /TAXON_ID=136419 /ORGANISM="Unknown Unknown, Strain D1" /LENGTH=122 /DNA_ID=CAMNT_0016378657 /DNA_START=30 /DNA_END=398 /DNA_ORIENTATION=-
MAANKMYSMEEIKLHNKEDDMWMVLYGKVYNVTQFKDDHPGGPEIMLDNSGQDATEAFEEVFHSETARKQVTEYCIGSVEGYTGPEMPASGGGGAAGGGGGNMVFLIPVVLIILGLLYKNFA